MQEQGNVESLKKYVMDVLDFLLLRRRQAIRGTDTVTTWT